MRGQRAYLHPCCRYHSLVVDSSSLPDELEPLAWSTGQHHPVALQHTSIAIQQHHQQHHHQLRQQQQHLQEELIMALRHKQRPHYGVQFHPESIATRYGIQVLMNFRDIAYKHTGRQLPHSLTANMLVQPTGPPGRLWAPRPWPTQHWRQQQQVLTAYRHLLSSLAPAASLSSSRAPEGLQLSWLKLPGMLSAAGGSERLFQQLVGPGPDTFWLDR